MGSGSWWRMKTSLGRGGNIAGFVRFGGGLVRRFAGEAGGEGIGLPAVFAQPADHDVHGTVGDEDARGAGGADGGEEARPIGVVRHDESAIQRLAAAGAADAHPSGGEGGGDFTEAAQPWGTLDRRGSDDEAA